jgi:hypothetical protein
MTGEEYKMRRYFRGKIMLVIVVCILFVVAGFSTVTVRKNVEQR